MPVVIIIAIITLIIYLLLGFSIGKALITFVTILVVACFCRNRYCPILRNVHGS